MNYNPKAVVLSASNFRMDVIPNNVVQRGHQISAELTTGADGPKDVLGEKSKVDAGARSRIQLQRVKSPALASFGLLSGLASYLTGFAREPKHKAQHATERYLSLTLTPYSAMQ